MWAIARFHLQTASFAITRRYARRWHRAITVCPQSLVA